MIIFSFTFMKHKLPMFYGASMKLFKFAALMRMAPTSGESAMWNLLKEEAFANYKFRRQHPISTFIADFYSHELKLVIEIDGGYHLDKYQKEYDDFRDEDMRAIGIEVIRFRNEEVIRSRQTVLQKVLIGIELLELRSNGETVVDSNS